MLDIFAKRGDLDEDKLHTKFKFLRDQAVLFEERKILMNWTEGFLDRDNKIIKEFQTTFHSSFWEFYLYRVLKDAGFEIDFTHNSPDFMIKYPIELNIEAVTSNIKKGGLQEKYRNSRNILSMVTPPHLQDNYRNFLNEAIARNSNAIHSKSTKYLEKYRTKSWIKEETPFLIALSSYGQIDYGREYYYPLLALLYGLYFIPTTNEFKPVTEISKPDSNSLIPVGIFKNIKFEHISAIIFSCTTTLGKLTSLAISDSKFKSHPNTVINIREDYEPPIYKIQTVSFDNPEELSDGLFIFHNPLAKNKVAKEIFSHTNAIQFNYENDELTVVGENLPIVSRLNTPNYMINNEILTEISKKFNRQF